MTWSPSIALSTFGGWCVCSAAKAFPLYLVGCFPPNVDSLEFSSLIISRSNWTVILMFELGSCYFVPPMVTLKTFSVSLSERLRDRLRDAALASRGCARAQLRESSRRPRSVDVCKRLNCIASVKFVGRWMCCGIISEAMRRLKPEFGRNILKSGSSLCLFSRQVSRLHPCPRVNCCDGIGVFKAALSPLNRRLTCLVSGVVRRSIDHAPKHKCLSQPECGLLLVHVGGFKDKLK